MGERLLLGPGPMALVPFWALGDEVREVQERANGGVYQAVAAVSS